MSPLAVAAQGRIYRTTPLHMCAGVDFRVWMDLLKLNRRRNAEKVGASPLGRRNILTRCLTSALPSKVAKSVTTAKGYDLVAAKLSAMPPPICSFFVLDACSGRQPASISSSAVDLHHPDQPLEKYISYAIFDQIGNDAAQQIFHFIRIFAIVALFAVQEITIYCQ